MTSGQKHRKLGVCPTELWKKRVLVFLIRASLCGHFLKVFIEFATVLLLFFSFFGPKEMWDLSSLTREQTHFLWVGRQNLNHQDISCVYVYLVSTTRYKLMEDRLHVLKSFVSFKT